MRTPALFLLSALIAQSSAWGFDPGLRAQPVHDNSLLSRVNIFGSDDRVEVAQGGGSDYAAVGYLEVAVPPSFCGEGKDKNTAGDTVSFGQECFDGGTAFLVSARHILTSAHVAFAADLYNLSKRQTSTFWIGRYAKAKATPVAWGDYRPTEYRDGQDWALLELDKPLGHQHGWFGLHAMAEGAAARDSFKVMSIGFPHDVRQDGYRLMLDPDCRIRHSALAWNNWQTDCATRGGNSGGPVFYRDGGILYAIAIISGSRGETPGVVSTWSGVRTNIAVPVAEVLPRIASIIEADQLRNAGSRLPGSQGRPVPPRILPPF